MKKSTRFVIIVIGMIFMSSWHGSEIASAEEKKTYEFRWGHIYPTDSEHHQRSLAVKDEVKEKTDGRIQIEIYPNSQLGDWTEQHEQLMRGSIEFALIPVSTQYDPRLNFIWLPYMVKNYDSAEKFFGDEGKFYSILEELLREQDVKLLSVWAQGLGGVALTKEPPSPRDPDVKKNIKIRVPGLKAFQVSYNLLGYNPTPIPLTDTYTAIQTGVVEGQAGGGPYQAWAQFRDVTKYWVQYNDYFEVWMFGMNLDLWESLSTEDQKILQSACVKQAKERFESAAAEDRKYMQKLDDMKEVEVIELTEEEIDKCANKVRSEGWPELEENIGKSVMDEIKSTVGYEEKK